MKSRLLVSPSTEGEERAFQRRATVLLLLIDSHDLLEHMAYDDDLPQYRRNECRDLATRLKAHLDS